MRIANFRWGYDGSVQSMEVEHGRVVRRGPDPSPAQPGDRDLGGAYLLPAFIDAHCHILPTGLDLRKLHLGGCATREDVLEAVRARHAEQPDGWLHAVHYDQTKFPDGRHLTRQELDAIVPNRPVLLRHSNGHASVANTAALEAARVGPDTPDPEGGSFVRDASGHPTGVLLERAHEIVTSAAPGPTREEMVEAILAAGDKMADLGIACASDMMTGRFSLRDELAAYRLAAERGCRIRTRLYLQWAEVYGPRAMDPAELRDLETALDPATCRVAGIKIFADGAIASATAAIYGAYTGEAPAGPVLSRRAKPAKDYAPDGSTTSGQLIYAPDRLAQMVARADADGRQVAIHAIGDYAVDLVMDAYEATGNPHRLEHAMLLSDAQIGRMARLGISCTFQPEFLLRFGHAYLRQLGPDRAYGLKRARSVKDAGIPLSFNSDRPIVPGDPWDGILTAADREAHGFDPAENLTREEGIRAYTEEGAAVNGDGRTQGTLEPDAWADFQLYADDPMAAARPRPTHVEAARP